MLAVPDETVHRTKVADWLELEAISSPDGRVGFGTLISATALSEEEQPQDMVDENAKHLADGLQIAADGEKNIERVKDIGKVVTWVTKYTKKLQAAVYTNDIASLSLPILMWSKRRRRRRPRLYPNGGAGAVCSSDHSRFNSFKQARALLRIKFIAAGLFITKEVMTARLYPR